MCYNTLMTKTHQGAIAVGHVTPLNPMFPTVINSSSTFFCLRSWFSWPSITHLFRTGLFLERSMSELQTSSIHVQKCQQPLGLFTAARGWEKKRKRLWTRFIKRCTEYMFLDCCRMAYIYLHKTVYFTRVRNVLYEIMFFIKAGISGYQSRKCVSEISTNII